MRNLEQLGQSFDTGITDIEPPIVTEGFWGDIPWTFIGDSNLPALELCTAAFCIVTVEGKLLLVQHGSRGYEFPGGHLDEHEDVDVTVRREILEETGAVIHNPVVFGHKKVSPHQPIPLRDDPTRTYPFPHSYVPYFFAEATELFSNPQLTEDVTGTVLVSFDEALALLAEGHNHDKILHYLVSQGLVQLR